MTRPVYETEDDKLNEMAIGALFGAYSCLVINKLPRFFPLDFAGINKDNQIKMWVEIKARIYSSKQIDSMGGYMISLAKIMKAERVSSFTGCPFFLVVGLSDGVFYKKMDQTPQNSFMPSSMKLGGRRDRNDPEDTEPCLFYDINQFKIINYGDGL